MPLLKIGQECEELIARIDCLIDKKKSCEKDELGKFIFDNGFIDELNSYRTQFFNRFLNICEEIGIEYVSINSYEILGDNSRYEHWPAIWKAAEIASVFSGCGNGNQSQTKNLNLYFPKGTIGFMWNVKERKIIKEAEYLFNNHR